MRILFFLVCVVASVLVVAGFSEVKADPSSVRVTDFRWERPLDYVDGTQLEAGKPDGYRVFISRNPAPKETNAVRVLDVVGANVLETPIPSGLGDGTFYARATAYILSVDEGGEEVKLEGPWSNRVNFSSAAGTYTRLGVPAAPQGFSIFYKN